MFNRFKELITQGEGISIEFKECRIRYRKAYLRLYAHF